MPQRLPILAELRFMRRLLDLFIVVAATAAVGFVMWLGVRMAVQASMRTPAPPPVVSLPSAPVKLLTSTMRGSNAARVGVLEFSDFECPYCGMFAQQTDGKLDETYVRTGKVVWSFSHFPLEAIHQHAVNAALAAECAGREGRFWQMHDLLFRNQDALDLPSLDKWLVAAGVSKTVKACADAGVESAVRAQMAAALKLEVMSTPTFFVGRIQPDGTLQVTQRLSGAQPFERFSAVLDELLKQEP